MYSVLAHVTVQPQHMDEFIDLIREHASASLRDEAGTLGFDVIQDEAAPNHIYFHETYADEEACTAHLQGAILARNLPRIAALVVGNLDRSVTLGKGFNIAPAGTD
jgi:(4S)-4-hydroxy-5-phosphonooxypentane-2,3-dione isomerase